ncbi:transcription factor bHLH51-like [Olea europaea var. sylvestris]|uniref:transcription factor bHLH51-like n=1 Tax=Olea europaea var. sylvestris TaxID=158386 RepID=UPI000C1D6140|nr:transcription factor bHLH51-like [Olea europaea var. sylvestris]
MENCFWPEEYRYASWNQSQSELESDNPFLVPWLPPNPPPPGEVAASEAALQFHCYPSSVLPPWPAPFEGVAEDRGGSASRSHSEAEKRRRDRINGQLATLRKLIPKSEKMDKAALLGQVVEHVKDLRQKAKEISKISTIPTDIDEVTIDHLDLEESSMENNIYIKASVCCDDRPELFAELNCALKGLRLTILEADITSLGGRMKAIFALCAKNGMEEKSCFSTLKQSLYIVLNRVAMSSATSNYRARSKRQRFFYPSH